jgi:hypothetical protein
MARFTEYINEKVSKKEMDEMLRSKDILIGAEFEFKVQKSRMDNIEDEYRIRRQDSEEYEDEHAEWATKHAEYGDEEEEAIELAKVSEDETEYMRRWYDEHEEPIEPEQPDWYIGRWAVYEVTYEDVERVVKDHMFSKSNLKQYAYDWEFEEDTSLSDYGIEIKSPPMELDDFLVACKNMFKMINDIGYTDSDCGFHIGISLKQGMDEVDPVKVAMFVDEGYIWKMFSTRKANMYAQSMQSVLRKQMYNVGWNNRIENSVAQIIKVKNMLKTTDIKLNFHGDHYHGVNVSHLEDDNKYIEYRYIGSKDYQNRLPDITKIIAHYIYALKIARDPEFKKKEYILKCGRMLAKFETWVVTQELQRVEQELEDARANRHGSTTGINIEYQKAQEKNLMTAIKNLTRRLQYLPKLNNEELDFMRHL